MVYKIILGDCEVKLEQLQIDPLFKGVHLTFLDPPFNQNKEYTSHNDAMPEEAYWQWMNRICQKIFTMTAPGGALYFMQREKNTAQVLNTLHVTGWTFQNLIIWKKLTSAVPNSLRFGKQYQILAFATKGDQPRVFNRLRIDVPPPPNYKIERENGIYVTDIWDDIRELTSGYFAGDEAIRVSHGVAFTKEGDRFHKQQTPIRLLMRIILASSLPRDIILDPFAGTGVTAIVAEQLARDSFSIELDPQNIDVIKKRLLLKRPADDLSPFLEYYQYTDHLESLLPNYSKKPSPKKFMKSIEDFLIK